MKIHVDTGKCSFENIYSKIIYPIFSYLFEELLLMPVLREIM